MATATADPERAAVQLAVEALHLAREGMVLVQVAVGASAADPD